MVYETLCHDTCLGMAQNAPMSLSDVPVFQNMEFCIPEMETLKKKKCAPGQMALYKLSPGGDSYSLGQQPESALKKTWPEGVNTDWE